MGLKFEPTQVTYSYFAEHYLSTNRPCVLGRWSTSHWKAIREWRIGDEPNFSLLNELFGKELVPMVLNKLENSYENTKYVSKTFAEFLDFWQLKHNQKESSSTKLDDLWYVKDWHFHLTHANDRFYEKPIFCQSDFLNEFYDIRNAESHDPTRKADDFRFLYAGVAGTWTPLHFDVLNSFSWSTNIIGVKLWYLVEEGDEKLLPKGVTDLRSLLPDRIKDDQMDSLMRSEKEARDNLSQPSKIGRTHEVHGARIHEVLQFDGELIFVPSGWHHQVMNVTAALSINENWFNAFNIDRVAAFFITQYDSVVEELTKWQTLDDCEIKKGDENAAMELLEAEKQRQLVLKADLGFDFDDLFSLLQLILRRRCAALSQQTATRTCIDSCSCESDLLKSSMHTGLQFGHSFCSLHLSFDVACVTRALTSLCEAMRKRSPTLFCELNYEQRLSDALSLTCSAS